MTNIRVEIREYPKDQKLCVDDLTHIGKMDIIYQLKEMIKEVEAEV